MSSRVSSREKFKENTKSTNVVIDNSSETYSEDEKEKRHLQNKIIAEKKYQDLLAKKDNETETNSNKLREAEFGWKKTDTLGSIPPSDYTITSINQNYDLLVS